MEPALDNSTREEREKYIRDTFRCRGDCDICGICQMFHHKEPEEIYKDYIDGKRTMSDISMEYRRV